MQKMLIALMMLLSLSGCSYFHVHKMDIEQGNVITAEMVSKVRLGMTEAEVRNIMGSPVLTNVFNPNRMDYVYTYKPGYGDYQERYITYSFQNGRLANIGGNMYSQFIR
jgi:outer membrane protein assembly factor BamE